MTNREIDDAMKIELEAAAFRSIKKHLQEHTELQNIDLMELAGFCRNCMAKWYQQAASEQGISLSKAESREEIYGMPYSEWKEKYQK